MPKNLSIKQYSYMVLNCTELNSIHVVRINTVLYIQLQIITYRLSLMMNMAKAFINEMLINEMLHLGTRVTL